MFLIIKIESVYIKEKKSQCRFIFLIFPLNKIIDINQYGPNRNIQYLYGKFS
ncbi:MAG: hypothetical protein BAJALOKI2v1_50017 [Promethearchaeota archaeon]|nr:MAG: hypothetical protein BAJALOKI2v1_50017 [Candidatus Lokiarchaeota archaeon]